MSDKRYTQDHEWVAVDGDTATVGISTYAQEQLGDLVFVELPAVGKEVSQGDELAVVESVKAASEVYAPIDGTVTEANAALADAPETVNTDAEGEGWFVKMTIADAGQLDALMTADKYQEFLATLD
jgi:glycine cleavage system H protein